MRRILYLEPFHGGSHRRFGERLMARIPARWTPLTMSGHHWKWRMRGAAPHWALTERPTLEAGYELLLASSFLDLATLVGLVPGLGPIPKVLYFHENQFAYPVREERERDHHYGLTQLLSGLAADRLVLNSAFNRDSFLLGASAWLRRLPRPRPRGWTEALAARSEVLALPLELDESPLTLDPPQGPERRAGPLIVWNHRWEHDKAPGVFFDALRRLAHAGHRFRVAVLGERNPRAPSCFETAEAELRERIVVFGGVEDRAEYLGWLHRAQIAVSTAEQEFFGIAAIEASHAGAWVLVPDRLAYPEVFPPEHRYRDVDELVARLAEACDAWTKGERTLRADRRDLSRRFGSPTEAAWSAAIERWSAQSSVSKV